MKLTKKQYLALHPEKYVMVTYEFGNPVFIAPCLDLSIQKTSDKSAAEVFTSLDNTATKLGYHIAASGFKGLKFERI